MAEVLTWVIQRRVVLADRVEQLRKELAETEAEVARLGTAEVVFGQFVEVERAGEADDSAMDAEFEHVTTAPGAGGMRLIPDRADGMDAGVLPKDYHARERAANEHGCADLKNWRVLTKLRLNARHATAMLRALLVLTRTEVSR